MRDAAETALHKNILVALSVNNPQLAVRLSCRARQREQEGVIECDKYPKLMLKEKIAR